MPHLAHPKKATPLFLLPNFTFVLELIVFLIVLGIVAKYILPPIRAAMNEREGRIQNAVDSAEQARREAAELTERRRHVLEAARVEARRIVDEASEGGEQLRVEGRRRGQEEYERLMQGAHGEIELARQRAHEEVMGEVGDLVLRAAERVIGSGLDDARHRALVEEALTAARSGGIGS